MDGRGEAEGAPAAASVVREGVAAPLAESAQNASASTQLRMRKDGAMCACELCACVVADFWLLWVSGGRSWPA